MKRILAISIASASIAIGAIPALAEVDAKIHALCLDAKDYSGCVQTQTLLREKSEEAPIDNAEGESSESTAWQEHLNENPTLKIWVEANPALGRERKKKWLSDNVKQKHKSLGLDNGCPEFCYFSPSGQCSAVTSAGTVPCSDFYEEEKEWIKNAENNARLENEEKNARSKKYEENNATKNAPQLSSCPPGKRQFTKTHFFGLIKGAKLCLTDYEVEALRQGERNRTDKALKNFTDSMNKLNESMQPQQQVIIQQPLLQPVQPPRVINCYSNTYGHYTSTSCY
tara:strand:- start:456 stop:1304 length:849 start_codon:yes stop_codon:yes gene_type:complete